MGQSRPHVAHSNNKSKTEPKKAKERKDGICSNGNCELQTQDNSATTREKQRPTKQLQPPIHSRKHLFETLPRFHGLCKPKWDKEMVVRRRWCDNQHKMVPIYHVEGDQKTFFLWSGVSFGMGAGLECTCSDFDEYYFKANKTKIYLCQNYDNHRKRSITSYQPFHHTSQN